MKKLLYVLVILIVLAVPSFAAWTVTATIDKAEPWANGMMMYRVKVTALSDGSDVASFALSTYLLPSNIDAIQGGMLRKVVTVPGASTTAPTTYTVALSDELGASLPITVTTTSTTAAEDFYPTDEVIFWDLNFDFPDIGDSGDIAYIYLYVVK